MPAPLHTSPLVPDTPSSQAVPGAAKIGVQSVPFGALDASHTPGVQTYSVPPQPPTPSHTSTLVAASPSSHATPAAIQVGTQPAPSGVLAASHWPAAHAYASPAHWPRPSQLSLFVPESPSSQPAPCEANATSQPDPLGVLDASHVPGTHS